MIDTSSVTPKPILQEIFEYKLQEVAQRTKQLPLANLQEQARTAPASRNFLEALRQNSRKPSLIAEIKKASPSKGVIRADFAPIAIAQAYERGGAACLSVLTDSKFFQGSFENLRRIREQVRLPLLCKEFIVDPYQIYLARVNGADAVLLIAAILSDREIAKLLQLTRELGMTALIEVHTIEEIDRVLTLPLVQLVGINNRNLQDFSVNLETTQYLLSRRWGKINCRGITIVSESGLYTAADLAFVAEAGADAVLVGESLLKQPNLEQAVQYLLNPRQETLV
ncbi:MAG: indole-3-glycerol phosphate synthase TrpC [Xenococcaceae cyanobacterium MO_188.B32]|nr:indole-3-glycerol phosphate synthase TrpC [Xenococcaceae cyanobacterium MO_188.B32]